MTEKQRTDEEILSDIKDALAWDSRIDARFVSFSVRNGVVTLSGTLNTFAEKAIANDVIARIKGVDRVIDRTRIQPLEIKDDKALAAELMERLRADPRVDERNISVEVARGVVTLVGNVSTAAEKRYALEDVWQSPGITSVIDRLDVQPLEIRADTQIESDIVAAIGSDARISEPTLIVVKSRNGKVYLRGGIYSPNEREAATEDAWSVAGVLEVVNELAIVYVGVPIPAPAPGTRLAAS